MMMLCCCWSRRRKDGRENSQSNSSVEKDDPDCGEEQMSKIQTLGKQYRLESIDSVRKMSLLQDLRREGEEDSGKSESVPEVNQVKPQCNGKLSASHANMRGSPSSRGGSSQFLDVPGGELLRSGRSQSTYLEFPEEEGACPYRQNSVTSRHMTMQEVIRKATLETAAAARGTAPLAKPESLRSLADSEGSGSSSLKGTSFSPPPSFRFKPVQRTHSKYDNTAQDV